MSTNEPSKLRDPERLQEIVRLRLHKDEVDGILDHYVKEAAEKFKLPISLVSVVMDSSQKFIASEGLTGWLESVQGTPVEWSFCANSVEKGSPFIVENAEQNPITNKNPLVTQDNIRCYAGVPITSKKGHVLGNFCVIGTRSREFSDDELNYLKEKASLISEELEERVLQNT